MAIARYASSRGHPRERSNASKASLCMSDEVQRGKSFLGPRALDACKGRRTLPSVKGCSLPVEAGALLPRARPPSCTASWLFSRLHWVHATVRGSERGYA